MSNSKRVAVVTGSNKGLGREIVKGLCKSFDGDVFLTARDEARGLEAIKDLQTEGLSPHFHLLDITDHDSIVTLRDFLQREYRGLDLLVNNAAVLFYENATESLAEQVKQTIQVNFFANLDVCQVLFPLLRPHARVVNMSSGAGRAGYLHLPSDTQTKLLKPDMSMKEVSSLMLQYSDAAQSGKLDEEGFHMRREQILEGLPAVRSDNGMGAYSYSKIGINLMTKIQQKEFDEQGADDIIVNCCCPGYVNTDMTHGNGILSVEEGAVTPLYCCLLPPKCGVPRGAFIELKQEVDWTVDCYSTK